MIRTTKDPLLDRTAYFFYMESRRRYAEEKKKGKPDLKKIVGEILKENGYRASFIEVHDAVMKIWEWESTKPH